MLFSVPGGAAGRMWSMATRSDSAEDTTPTVSVSHFVLIQLTPQPTGSSSCISSVPTCVYLLSPVVVTTSHNLPCPVSLQPIRTLWRRFSMGWRAAPPSWSVRPGRLTCLSSGTCWRRTATGEKRWADQKRGTKYFDCILWFICRGFLWLWNELYYDIPAFLHQIRWFSLW